METKFTSGEWRIDEFLSDDEYLVIEIGDADGTVLLERHIAGKDQHDLPNAHLIASAPRLYELLDECRYNASMPKGLLEDIEKVLAQSRGENLNETKSGDV